MFRVNKSKDQTHDVYTTLREFSFVQQWTRTVSNRSTVVVSVGHGRFDSR